MFGRATIRLGIGPHSRSFFYGLFVTRTGRTGRPIFTIYTSYDVFLPKYVPFGSLVDIAPQNSNFGGVSRRFQAKLAKSKNMHIIKTTTSIPTDFCTAIKTTKCPLWVVRTHTTNPRLRTPAIFENRKITISGPWFERFQRNFARRRSSALLGCPTVKSFKF